MDKGYEEFFKLMTVGKKERTKIIQSSNPLNCSPPKKIFLVESGLYGGDGKDLTIAFLDEQKAWEYALRKYKRYNLERRNWQRRKGFRGIIFGKKRWLCITQVRILDDGDRAERMGTRLT